MRGDGQDPQAIALMALGWLAAEPERLSWLLGASGSALEDLRARASDPAFLGFVLEFVLSDEGLARAFAEEAGLQPETAHAARARLPGGEAPNWT